MLRLEELRKKNGLSQNELAEKLNMTQQRISAYEKGKREPDINTIKQLADFFGVSTDYLLGKTDIRNPEKKEPDLLDLAKIGFSMDKYNPPNEKQKEQIRDILEIILKDNKKEK